MEKPRPPMEEAKREDEDESPEEGRGFLSQWLDRLRSSQQEAEKESEGDEEKLEGKQSKRWQRFFGRLFRQVVEPVNSGASKESSEEAHEPVSITAEALPINISERKLIDDETNELGTEQQPPAESAEAPGALSDLGSEENPKESPEPLAGIPAPESETLVSTWPETTLGPRAREQDASLPEAVVYERPKAPASRLEADKPEVVVERGRRGLALVTGLLGAEFLARRRADRKIRYDLKKLREEAKSNAQAASLAEAKRLSKLEAVSQRIAPLEKTNKVESKTPLAITSREAGAPEPEHAEVRRSFASEVAPIVEQREKIGTTMPMHDRIKQHSAAEISPPPERAPAVESLEPLMVKEAVEAGNRSKESAPDKVLEKVAEAADKNIPLEKLYERRHEVKDVPTKTAGAAPISTILSRMDSETAGVYSAINQSSANKGNQSSGRPPVPPSQDMYLQAMKNGFLAAVVLIAFIVVAAFTRN